MGKGQRNKTKAAATFAAANENRSNTTKTVIRIVCAVLIVAMLGALIGYGRCVNDGYYLRNTVAMKTEHYTVTNAMMTYFFNQTLSQAMNSQYYYYYVAAGLDTSISLKNQISQMGGGTWFDFFMDQTVESVKEVLTLAEAAMAAGVNLTADEIKEIDDQIALMRETAKKNGGEDYYIRSTYGFGVKLDDIRETLLIAELASKFAEQIGEELDEMFTKEDFDKYYEEHTKEMSYADILTYTFTYTPEKKADATATTDKKDEKAGATGTATSDATATGTTEKEDLGDETNFEFIQKYADELAACKTAEEFEKYVRDYITNVTYKDYEIVDDVTEKDETATGTATSDAAATGTTEKKTVKLSKINELVDAIVKDRYTYTEDNKASEWVFGGEASEYTTNSFKSYDKKTDKYSIQVVMVKNPMYRDDYATKDVMHILIGVGDYGDYEESESVKAKLEAEKLLADFLASGDVSKDAFEKLAKEHTDDSGILYEDVQKDEMVDEFNDWIYDEARKAGDTDVVETDFGYHIMYFVGDGEIAWELQADTLLQNEKYEEMYEGFEKAHPITIDEAALKAIDG